MAEREGNGNAEPLWPGRRNGEVYAIEIDGIKFVLPRRCRLTFEYLDGYRNGLWVLYDEQDGRHPSGAVGPFDTAVEAREWAIKAAGTSCGQIVIDWDRFPYAPDPKNGEVYAIEIDEIKFVDGVETKTFGGFVVLHMADDRDSAAILRGYETLEEAQADAKRIARKHSAVLSCLGRR
jgi:hypothetical protein